MSDKEKKDLVEKIQTIEKITESKFNIKSLTSDKEGYEQIKRQMRIYDLFIHP